MSKDFEVIVQGQVLEIPYRIYEESFLSSINALFSKQADELRMCQLTRHHDGFVRQQYVKKIITFDNPVVAPYLIRLCGEYVKEILEVIHANLDSYNPAFLRSFILENRPFYEKNRCRMISYWTCYYRYAFPKLADYVGFKLFKRLDAIAKGANESVNLNE